MPKRDTLLQVRFTQDELAKIREKANKHGISSVAWARVLLLNFDFEVKRVDDDKNWYTKEQ